jgi:hypothetical protein
MNQTALNHLKQYAQSISNMGDIYGMEPLEENIKKDFLMATYEWWIGNDVCPQPIIDKFNEEVKEILLPKIEDLLITHPNNKLLLRYWDELNDVEQERYYNDVQAFEVLLIQQAKVVPIVNIEQFPDDYFNATQLIKDLEAASFAQPKINLITDLFDRPGKHSGQWFSRVGDLGVIVADCKWSPNVSLDDALKIAHEWGHFLASNNKTLAPDLEEIPAVQMECWLVDNLIHDENLKRIAKQHLEKKYQDYLVQSINELRIGAGCHLTYRYALAYYYPHLLNE